MTPHPTETKLDGDRRRKFNRELGPVPETAHGKANGYNNYHCTCDRCLAWCAERAQARRDAAKNLEPDEPIVWTLELIRELTA